MTYLQRFVGPGGSDAANGTSYALRKLTWTGLEAVLSAATRYTCHIAPGTYRETDTLLVSGPAPYTAGTVSVVLGSLTVTGTGTAWLANAEANDYFQVLKFASGTDGVTNGTSTFTSAAGNFQAGHVGMTIRIDTKVAGVIATVVSATEITLKDTANAALTPSAGTGLTYDVGPSGPIKIASVESDTSLTLAAPWDFPTLTGLAYRAWGHIEYVGDYTGANTDGVGGIVRITGSDNDQTGTRVNCVTATSRNQRTFSQISLDTPTGILFSLITDCSNWVISKCALNSNANFSVLNVAGIGTAVTVTNCLFFVHANGAAAILFTHSATTVNSAGLVQNCIFVSPGLGAVVVTRVGGIRVRNCFSIGRSTQGFQIITALSVGQALTVNNCVVHGAAIAFNGTIVGEILENYNDLSACNTNRTNTTIGANSVAYAWLPDLRWFFQLVTAGAGPYSPLQVISPFDLASYSQVVNLAGTNPTVTDMRGTAVQGAQREWGALEYDSTLKIFGGIKKSRLLQGH